MKYYILFILGIIILNIICNKPKKIIHISGLNASGKSTLGMKLRKNIRNTIIIDIDTLLFNFIRENENSNISVDDFYKYSTVNFQKYIDNFISKTNKNIIFIGLNYQKDGYRITFKNQKLLYNNNYVDLHQHYSYFIDIDNIIIIQRLKERDTYYKNNKDDGIKQYYKNHKYYNNDTIKEMNETKEYYKKHNYVFASFDEIYISVIDILQ